MNAVPQYSLHRESAVFVSAVDIHSDAQLSFWTMIDCTRTFFCAFILTNHLLSLCSTQTMKQKKMNELQ